jgi:hypothetical protein
MISLPAEYTFTADIRRGTKGKNVTFVQEWLSLNSVGIGIDGDFGPATEAAVKKFQQKVKLPVTGIVDRTTFEALIAPARAALQPIKPGKKTLGALVVAYAQQHVKQRPREVGGQNKGPWVRLYMKGKQGKEFLWCAGFVSFILQQAADTLREQPPVKYTFGCDELAGFGKAGNIFVPEKDVASGTTPGTSLPPGSIFLVRKKPGDWVHTGIVTAFHDDHFETIEGNTNDGGSSEGFEACSRTRAYAKKDFIRLQ